MLCAAPTSCSRRQGSSHLGKTIGIVHARPLNFSLLINLGSINTMGCDNLPLENSNYSEVSMGKAYSSIRLWDSGDSVLEFCLTIYAVSIFAWKKLS